MEDDALSAVGQLCPCCSQDYQQIHDCQQVLSCAAQPQARALTKCGVRRRFPPTAVHGELCAYARQDGSSRTFQLVHPSASGQSRSRPSSPTPTFTRRHATLWCDSRRSGRRRCRRRRLPCRHGSGGRRLHPAGFVAAAGAAAGATTTAAVCLGHRRRARPLGVSHRGLAVADGRLPCAGAFTGGGAAHPPAPPPAPPQVLPSAPPPPSPLRPLPSLPPSNGSHHLLPWATRLPRFASVVLRAALLSCSSFFARPRWTST